MTWYGGGGSGGNTNVVQHEIADDGAEIPVPPRGGATASYDSRGLLQYEECANNGNTYRKNYTYTAENLLIDTDPQWELQ